MIEVHRLSKKFDQRGIAGVHDLSLTVQTGEVFALLGPNGSGKTSLLNLIARKVVPDSGEIKVTGTAQLATFLESDREMNVQLSLIHI